MVDDDYMDPEAACNVLFSPDAGVGRRRGERARIPGCHRGGIGGRGSVAWGPGVANRLGTGNAETVAC